MKMVQGSWVLVGIAGLVLMGGTTACTTDNPATGGTGGSPATGGMAGMGGMEMGGMGGMGMGGAGGSMIDPQHEQFCKLIQSGAGKNSGYDVPGEAGAPRWGIPKMPPATKRVRRSWSTLTNAEQKQVVDAFLALKKITPTSGDPGSPRADYTSFCSELSLPVYEKNLYDFYVEAHVNAYVSMMTPKQSMTQMVHKAPDFLPWHRYLLLRLETDMGEAIGDPNFALPYWDWTDCYKDGNPPTTCKALFDTGSYLGSPGSCDNATSAVTGYLADQGFITNMHAEGMDIFNTASITCGQRPITRNVGCTTEAEAGPPDAAAINGIFARMIYDAAPFDGCHTDEGVSFRQYLEGFSNKDLVPICIGAGCAMHGRAHFYIGGDVQKTTSAPNDPVFFLLHAEVDRLWAAWQEDNIKSGDPKRMMDHGNPGFPADYAGSLANFTSVNASEVFDYQALGYDYDSLPAKQP